MCDDSDYHIGYNEGWDSGYKDGVFEIKQKTLDTLKDFTFAYELGTRERTVLDDLYKELADNL